MFVKSKNSDGKYKSIYGESLERLVFQDLKEAGEFIQTYEDVDNFEIFGNTGYQYQYITDTYAEDIQYDFKDICVISLDIETASEHGFPQVDNPDEEVLLITTRNLHTKEVKTFGARPFDVSRAKHIKNPENYEYVKCKNEADLFKNFLKHWQVTAPDIITGWNSEFFDIPYVVARIERVLGEEWAKLMSPWKIYRRREVENNKKVSTVYQLYGITHLDYLALYKKFVQNKEESYKLDYIAEKVLERNKLENDYSSFKDFYTKDWQLFVEYNVVDVELVDALEGKMKFIEMVVNMAYYAKCNFEDIFFAVRTWDCILYNHLLKKNIVVPMKKENEHDRKITGAYVKDPVVGLHNWVVCFDATSLYPSIILQYNMSPETLRDEVVDTNVEKLLAGETYRGEDVAISALGYVFDKKQLGIFPEIVETMFAERVKYKNLMLEAKQKYKENPTPQLANDVSKYNNYQQARKIQLNSLYGAWGNKYFRFFDHRIAESVTITGQYIIRYVGKKLDEYLNKICGTTGETFVVYMDTDSCYISMDKVVKKFFPNRPLEETIDLIDKICSEKLVKVTDRASEDIVQNTSAYKHAVNFKREVIAARGVWFRKKRYALNVYDNEGIRYNEPDLKIMGVEIVRSDSPRGVKEYLKKSIDIILNDSEQHMHEFIATVEGEYKDKNLSLIAIPTSVNNMAKYSSPLSIYTKGTPMHVRASLLYNYHIKKNKLEKKYELIGEGDKVKFLFLRTPNPIKENVIAFKGELPKELDLHRFIDYNSMLERTFIDPIIRFTEPLGWTPRPIATLDDLF